MNISLYLIDRIVNFKLPNQISGSFSFDVNPDEESKLINIESKDDKWILYQTPDVTIITNEGFTSRVVLVPDNFYVLRRDNKNYLIYVNLKSMPGFITYKYDHDINLVIGNTPDSNVKYDVANLNNMLVRVFYKDNFLVLENSSNSIIYINKIAVKNNVNIIKNGDEVEIYGLRLIFLNGVLLVNNIPGKLSVDTLNSKLTNVLFPKQAPPENKEIKDIDLYNEDDYFSKAPRIRRIIKTKTIKLSAPPKDGESQELPLILVIGPMLTMGSMSAVTLLETLSKVSSNTITLKDSWPQLLTSGTMLISMIVWPIVTQAYNRHMNKKKKKEIIIKYNNYLDEKDKELEEERNLQKIILLENLITVEQCLDIIVNKSLNFWDKRIDQNDFLVTRIGVGDEKLDVKIEYPEEGFTIEESELRKNADKLIEKYKYIKSVPIGYSFYENKITAIMGDRYKSLNFMHNTLLQLISFYSYEDLKIVTFTSEDNENNWNYLRYLNHSFNNDKSFRFFSSDIESAKKVSEYIYMEVTNRMNQVQNDRKNLFKPYYLIIVDDYDLVKRYEFMKTLTEMDVNLGFSLIIVENRLSNLPSKCNNFITIGKENSGVLKKSYEKQEQIIFKDEINYNIDMMQVAKVVSNVPIEFEESIGHLPNSITFLEMEKVGKVEQLNILNRWNTNDSTTSLKAEVGVDEQGELMFLDLHEKYHGPHGLIAGMTGSGKSEFIITYILSMAINYSPDDVSFILIDYKGGGLAFAFENNNVVLPHLSGTITNLDKAEMDRTLVSIDSEIKRRQKIFNEARDSLGESTIDIYKYQKFYKEGKLNEAISHLFIICDEFAELKSQQPEFMDNLISVARIGRSLGVHLILATQKPSGVVNDQIWSNTKFRVCLKVQDESDSKEMLKRPDAASLKQTGRFYLQVGYDEYFALGQSAWCGAQYYPSDKIIKQVNKSVDFINDFGGLVKSVQASNGIKISAEGEQLAAIMKNIIEVSNKVNKKAKRLWLENIPPIILESNLREKYSIINAPYNIEAILGEYDAPEKQYQDIVKYNYIEDGNTIIYGNDGSERELLLNTMIYSTTSKHKANEINYYIIDYGSESLRRFISLPQVGGMVFAGEDEKYYNLLKLIREELQKRKKLFVDYGGEYINYIQNSNDKLPLQVIIINNYDSIYENYPEIYDDLPELIRDSERYGVVFIITCNSVNSVQSKISQNCSNTYAFKLKDASDYTILFGSKSKIVPRNIEGRGILKIEGVHEFQTAHIVENDDELNKYLLEFVEKQNQINNIKARKIPTLPDIVRYEDVYDEHITLRNVPIGISKSNLEICKIDYLSNQGNIISSNKLVNTLKFVKSLLFMLRKINNSNLIVIDSVNSLLLNINEFPHYYVDHFDMVLDTINNYLQSLIDKSQSTEGIILVYGISKLLNKLDDNTKFSSLVSKVKEYEKFGLIIVDDASSIKKYNFDDWFTSLFSINDGVWIGKGIADQNLLHLSTITRDMTKEYKNDMGYVISESSAVLSKFIDFISSDTEGDNNE